MSNLFGSKSFPNPPYDSTSSYLSRYSSAQLPSEPMTFDTLVMRPLDQIATDILQFLPNFIRAVFILLVGWLIARVLQWIVSLVLKSIGFNKFADHIGITTLIQQDGGKTEPNRWFGRLTFWLIMVFSMVTGLGQLNLYIASRWLNDFSFFVITILTTLVIFVFGVFLSILSSKVVLTVTQKFNAEQGALYAAITRWAVLMFTFLISLRQFGLPAEVILSILGVAYVTLCITFVIAFGGGGVGWAARVLDKTLKK